MKPVLLKFQCFGPYRKEQVIDFEALEKNGVFLICGETGAGKTTILDAICYALYGRSSGGLRGELDVMRCKLARREDETRVAFVFDVGEKRYQFVRSLRYGRKKLNDHHNCMVWEDGAYVPFFENPKLRNVNQKAEEIIGLSYEQFRQVILLPQGQFERLLVSDSAEKESILVSLFGAEKWQQAADELYSRVAEEDRKLRGEIADIKSRLQDYDCTTVEELSVRTAKQGEMTRILGQEAQTAEVEERAKRKHWEETMLAQEGFDELQRRKEKVRALEEQKGDMEELEALLLRADAAEKVRPVYDAVCACREKERVCREEAEGALRQKEAAEAGLARIQAEQAAHEAGRSAQEAAARRLALLENMRGLYASLEQKKAEADRTVEKKATQKKCMETAEERFAAAHQDWLQAMESQRTAMDRYAAAQRSYLDGIRGTLAEKLRSGRPCPVCGSTEHPAPACRAAETVTERELDQRNQEVLDAGKAIESAAKEREEAERQQKTSRAAYSLAEQAALLAEAAYEELVKQKAEGIGTAKQLDKEITRLNVQVRAYTEQTEQLQKQVSKALGTRTAAAAEREKAEKAAAAARERMAEQEACWRQVRTAAGFPEDGAFEAALLEMEDKNEKKETLYRFRQELTGAWQAYREQEQKMAGHEKPDPAGSKAMLAEAEKVHREAEKAWILAQQTLKNMEADKERLLERKERYDKRRVEADKNLEFANRLRGRSGISLQRYVLGVMLSSITGEANRLLKYVHHGRYRLYRTDEIAGSGHKGGLELEVLDSQSNERRSVTTLSGGEKFLVALSLAIGLSTVVQAQGKGMRLGAMFIDEGFGTLDQNSIYDALEVLQGIQRANGLVGIISHVELLKNTIPNKIRVVKANDGSECIM